MGAQEKAVRKRRRLSLLKKTVIGAIAVAGVLTIATVAPNVIGAFSQLTGRKRWNKITSVRRTVWRLIDDGFVYIDETKKGKFIRLTPAGKDQLEFIKYKQGIKKPWRWDRKWRMVIFDVKEVRRHVRDKLRQTFRHMDFYHFQKSVWIYPYDFEDFLTMLKADQKIGFDVSYVIADSIEGDRKLRQYYGLSLK